MDSLGTSRTSVAGIVVVVLGVLFAADQGTEWMKQAVIAGAPHVHAVKPVCPRDELEEEGLSVAECEHLLTNVRGYVSSAPGWFPAVKTVLSAIGTVLALLSIGTGAALVDRHRWATHAVLATFGVLVVVDLGNFIATVNAGPTLRAIYLYDVMLWFFIHLAVTVAVIAVVSSDPRYSSTDVDPDRSMATPQTNPVAIIALHWLLAVAIFFLFVSSWWMLALPLPSAELQYRQFPFQLHKNVGLTLMLLMIPMLFIRSRSRPRSSSLDGKSWMAKLARMDHWVLYVLVGAASISGYLSSSYSGWGTRLWWLVDLPSWGYENEQLNRLYSDLHLWTCWALLAAIAVHVAGALYHGFRDDGIAHRMLSIRLGNLGPSGSRRPSRRDDGSRRA